MFMTSNFKTSLCLLSSLLCIVISTAVSGVEKKSSVENKKEDIHIIADKMHFNLLTDTSIYNGNVKLTQGTMELTGDFIEIKQVDSQIISVITKGTPAQYHQRTEGGSKILAQSKVIKYFATENRLIMIESAKLVQDEQIIESERIVYDTEKKTLLAGQNSANPNKQERVKIRLTPSENKP